MSKTQVIILSGPSGVGKNTVWNTICRRQQPHNLEKIITTTARTIRPGEINGHDYHFISQKEFQENIDSGRMIEYALVHGKYYGSTFAELERIISLGKYPIYIIDTQGMAKLKPILEQGGYFVKTFFLLPPSIEELKNRLSGRGTEGSTGLELRLSNALIEMQDQDKYDFRITATHPEETAEKVIAEIEKRWNLTPTLSTSGEGV